MRIYICIYMHIYMYVFFIIFFFTIYIRRTYIFTCISFRVRTITVYFSFTLIYCSFCIFSTFFFFFFFNNFSIVSLSISLFVYLFVLPIKRSLHYPRSNKSQYLQLMRLRENSNSSQRTDIAFQTFLHAIVSILNTLTQKCMYSPDRCHDYAV